MRFVDKFVTVSTLLILMTTASAQANGNIIRLQAPISQGSGSWQEYTPLIGEWVRQHEPTQCDAWAPDATWVDNADTVQQTASCQFLETQVTQAQERNAATGVIRAKGLPVTAERQVNEISSRSVQGGWTGTEYAMTIGKYSKRTLLYWGYMDSGVRASYSISQNSEGSLDQQLYKNWLLSAVYFANDGTNSLVVAYSVEAPDTPPKSISINGQACTLKQAYYQNGGRDVLHYAGCGADLANKAGTVVTVKIR